MSRLLFAAARGAQPCKIMVIDNAHPNGIDYDDWVKPVALPLTPEELDLCRQWFNSVQDVNGGYLTTLDYVLAEKLYRQLNMRVPNSISEITKSGIGSGR